MDKVERYRTLITRLLSALATALNEYHTAHDNAVLAHCVFDTARDHYILLQIGWVGHQRIRGITLYVRLCHGKFWIERYDRGRHYRRLAASWCPQRGYCPSFSATRGPSVHRVCSCITLCAASSDPEKRRCQLQTEAGQASGLVELGVPKGVIVLAFHAPYKLPYTKFAAV